MDSIGSRLSTRKTFLARSRGTEVFKAYKFTKPTSTGEVAPLYRADRSLATEKKEQAQLLPEGTSVVTTEADLSDVIIPDDRHLDPGLDAPLMSEPELEDVIRGLPNGKA
ncbi:hypothetical protein CROQUDRAFT_242146 [Cronartium quercuum f. sp. fusiforme G11]|uniref:Uncharacterized protein n=1 Tax=Cronartium quercuum f. sp. fusiforme G11 TaxID=708437 RepID=A0A9P6N935_9BASI|nr:hypothetical protein CROQUDRAFT_242146 [Cronartium quercuum f. sp. fusiforme G11]